MHQAFGRFHSWASFDVIKKIYIKKKIILRIFQQMLENFKTRGEEVAW